jgi:hypothetical protein
MPLKHYRLSLAATGEARLGAFDPGWAQGMRHEDGQRINILPKGM